MSRLARLLVLIVAAATLPGFAAPQPVTEAIAGFRRAEAAAAVRLGQTGAAHLPPGATVWHPPHTPANPAQTPTPPVAAYIAQPPQRPSFTISGAPRVREGGTLHFVIARSGSDGAAHRIVLSYSNPQAVVNPPGSVTFPANRARLDLDLVTIATTQAEGPRAIDVLIAPGDPRATIASPRSARGYILDSPVAVTPAPAVKPSRPPLFVPPVPAPTASFGVRAIGTPQPGEPARFEIYRSDPSGSADVAYGVSQGSRSLPFASLTMPPGRSRQAFAIPTTSYERCGGAITMTLIGAPGPIVQRTAIADLPACPSAPETIAGASAPPKPVTTPVTTPAATDTASSGTPQPATSTTPPVSASGTNGVAAQFASGTQTASPVATTATGGAASGTELKAIVAYWPWLTVALVVIAAGIALAEFLKPAGLTASCEIEPGVAALEPIGAPLVGWPRPSATVIIERGACHAPDPLPVQEQIP